MNPWIVMAVCFLVDLPGPHSRHCQAQAREAAESTAKLSMQEQARCR